jgi:O-antigen ligase
MLLLLLFWGVLLILTRKPVRFGPPFIWVPLLGIIIAGFASTFSSLDINLNLYHVLRLSGLFLFYLYIVNEIKSPFIVIVSIASQIVFQSVYAILQFFLQHSVGLQIFGEHILDPAWSGVSIVSNGTERLLRSYSLTEHPNILGGCLAFGMVALLGVYLYGEKKNRKGVVLVFLSGLTALFFTFSRSAFLAFFSGAVFLIVENVLARRWQKLLPLVWLVLLSLLLLFPLAWRYSDFLAARVNIGNSFEKIPAEALSVQERSELNRIGLQVFFTNPLSGVGVGASPIAIKKYYPDFPGHFVPPHFSLLAVAMETGIPGLICYLFMLALPLIALIWRRKGLADNPYLVTASAVLVSFTVAGFFDIYPWLPLPGRLLHWLALGYWVVAYEKDETC